MASRILAGRYELIEKIGDGGMAVVYKARDRLLNRHVAIKILKPEFTKDVKIIESFRREAQAAANLSHPNIVNIYDVGREGNIHYIVMELIEGYILSDFIKENGAIEWKRAVEIAKQMALALSVAHKNNIIHRDVKPHNILITKTGTAKITDFGIAKAMDAASPTTENTGTVMGSVHYFSPEQARGGYVDEKSDIYSLGIVLYEMLTGRVPFDGDNPVQVALMHINEQMEDPRKINPSIPESVEKVVIKATDKIQVNRYSSADEMYKALEDAEFEEIFVGRKKPEKAAAAEADTESVTNTADTESENGGENELGKEKKSKHGGSKKKDPDRKVKILAVVVALLVALPLSYGIVNVLDGIFKSDGGREEFEAPDFCGMTFEAAQLVAEEYDIQIEKGDEVFSYDYEVGEISSQVPEDGTMIKKGKTIRVNVSKGMKEGTVPKLEGLTYSSAVHMIEKYNFKVGTVTTQTSIQPKDIVISQSPGAGDEATPGSYITFVVSAGTQENEAIIPLLVGMDIDTAKNELETAGLALGEITYETSTEYEVNQVMWQQYPADTTLEAQTPVDLKVSSGEEQFAATGLSLYIDYSSAEDSVFWLTVTVSDEEGPHNVITREQRIKEDGGETVTLTGVGVGTVTVIFNNDVVLKHDVDFNTGEILL